MDKVSLENVFLKETDLTSTKNKYLDENLDINEGSGHKKRPNSGVGITNNSSMKRKSPFSFLEDWKITHDRSTITSTENKFLPTYCSASKRKKKAHKSKKKTSKLHYRDGYDVDSAEEGVHRLFLKGAPKAMRSVSRSPDRFTVDSVADYCEDEMDCMRMNELFMASPSHMPPPGAGGPILFGGMNLQQQALRGIILGQQAPEGQCFAAASCPPATNSLTFGCTSGGIDDVPKRYAVTLSRSGRRAGKRMLAPPSLQNTTFGQGSAFNPQPDIFEMPVYSFDSKEEYQMETFESFDFLDTEANSLQLKRIELVKTKKMQFLNAASMALICNSNLKDVNDSYRAFITKFADDVRAIDPEFILKVALYSRQEMNIRSASNFLLSYAAYHEDSRPYLGKYFEPCIRLPSDWIEVAELYQVFADERLKNRSLPAALKRVMVKSFSKFDAYQLAKYNRDKTKNKKTLCSEVIETENTEETVGRKKISSSNNYTLKQLIRLLHLNSPANEVMCLLGKKYPETAEAFKKSGLSGVWDSKRAGKKMKLPKPETWETQISVYGNKAIMWEGLIDNSKLPYMAMLRNLRNLILSGISLKHHDKVLKQLENKIAVLNSRQLPLQFYEAFKVLITIEELLNENNSCPPEVPVGTPSWKQERMQKTYERIKNASNPLLERYKNAISKALEISALYNLQPIPGKSLVICDVLPPDRLGIKSKNKAYHMCIMMGLMCLKACEDCKMSLIYGNFSETVVLKDRPFLQSMMDICLKHENQCQNMQASTSVKSLNNVLEFYLKQQTVLKEKLDHIIFLRTSTAESCNGIKKTMASFLHKYRHVVNSELLYTDVEFSASNYSFEDTEHANGKDVYLSGNSTQLIKFIAERSANGQLSCVENIDLKYNLPNDDDHSKLQKLSDVLPKKEMLPVISRVPKWHTVRIFISSTFKDMHSEREMLIRYVIPELKKRAASVFVKINEVDLRWGITESDCASKRAAELCLLEAQKSDLFIGILGDRYGTMYGFERPDSPELQWVDEYCDLSITELEMRAGALRENKLREKKAFFYIRNSSFLSFVPEKYKSYFMSENRVSEMKLKSLKSEILSSGLKVFEGYPCRFAGLLKEKPILSGLDEFGRTVLDDLWKAISEMHERDPYVDDVAEEEIYQQHLLDSYSYFIESKNSPTSNFVKKIYKECGLFLISGPPGSGKTTFVVNMLKQLENFSVVKFFIGLTPRSTDVSYMLHFISNSISRYYPVSSVFPKLTKDVMNNFPDILHEAVCSSGNSNFILVIDGLDHLEIDDQMLDWLPLTLPQGLRLIFTASDSSYAFRVLSERQAHGTEMHIQNLVTLAQSDRECIVRHYLNLYGKSLDGSSFNNEMLQLITKKDSGVPLYLQISCDFLRTYATFDNFMSMLQSLPSTIPLLLQEIILQMENEYSSIVVQTALTLLCITKEGLDDEDLHLLLSLALIEKGKSRSNSLNETVDQISKIGPDNLLSKVTYCSLVHLICTFAFGHNRFKKLNLMGTEFEKASKKFYLNKNYSNFAKHMHYNLAAYYQMLCDPENGYVWKGRSALAYRGLIYHLFNGECYQALSDNLCCLKFLEALFSVGSADFLLEYYSLLLNEIKRGNSEASRKVDFPLLLAYNDFVSRNQHIFQIYPHLVTQQALNESPESLVKLSLEHINRNKCCMVECLSLQAYDPRVATLRGFVKNITAVSCQQAESIAVLGSEDGYLKVLDFSSKKIIRSVKSHSSAITFICFAGKNRICTASTDTTLSIWSSDDYSRISVLKGHKHNVSCCCADSSSSILFSSGWDNSVRLWSLRDGRSISVIDDFRCPVNCLDHHPMKQQIACGLWNGNVEIWDTVSLQKMLVLSNNCRSVKSIAYMPDGINIISSYMNSDVVIWSSEQGLKISNLKGHYLPVKSISYSHAENMIVSGSEDCTLKVWSTESGLSVNNISACKFCPISLLEIISSNILAVSFQNSDIWVIDINNGFVVSKMVLQSDMVSCFSRTNTTCCDVDDPFENWTDSSLVFGTQSGQISIGNFLTSTISCVGSITSRVTAIIHNKRIIICANSEGDLGVFSYPEINCKLVYGAHRGSVAALSLYIRNGNLCFISAASDKVMKLWKIDYEDLDVSLNHECLSKHNDFITSCCWLSFSNENDDHGELLTGSHDNNIILQGGNSETVFRGLKTGVVSVHFTDNYILGCGSDGSMALWSKEGKLLSYISGIEQSSAVLSFYIEKDASGDLDVTLAFADRDGSVKIRKPIQRSYWYSLEGHSKGVTSCCANQNGEILSCSLDGTVNLWKLPLDAQDICLNHSATVTDIIASMSDKIALSSDAQGSIILWEFVQTPTTCSLKYGSKKTYIGGFVKALSWTKAKHFVCAVTQTIDHEEVYFVDILSIECTSSDDCTLYNLQVKFTHYFESEVLCLQGNSTSETIVAAFKSGDFVVITPTMKTKIKPYEDWILHVKLLQHEDLDEYIYFSLLNGSIKRFKATEILKTTDYGLMTRHILHYTAVGDIPSYTSAFWCENEENVFWGDTQGYLRVYAESSISKKVHDDSLTGISVIGNYIFTCSLDRTLKGWKLPTLEQICQFHSAVPIACLVGCEVVSEDDSTVSYFLMIGTTSGAVQLLKFHPSK